MQINKNVDLSQYLFFLTTSSFGRIVSFKYISREGNIISWLFITGILLTPWNFSLNISIFVAFICFLVGRDIGTEINIKRFEREHFSEELMLASKEEKRSAARRVLNQDLILEEEIKTLFKDYLKQEIKINLR